MQTAPGGLERGDGAAGESGSRTGSERLLLAVAALGAMLAPLNSTMIAVALPDIRQDFALSHGTIGWLISAYLITMAVAQPVAGRLGDQLGRARVFRVSLLVFLGLSLAATLAPSFALLVALRIGQAAAGAALIPNGMAMLRETVPVHRLGRMNGFFNAAMATSAASGPIVGALVLEFSSWRALFLLNVPVVALALLLLARLRYRGATLSGKAEIDWSGGALLAAVLAAVTWLLGTLSGQASVAAVAAGIVMTALLTGVFVRREMTAGSGVAAWGLFRHRNFAGATTYVMVSNLVMYTALLTIPFFVTEVQGKGVAPVGALLGLMSVLMAVAAPASGFLSDSLGRRPLALAGSVITLAASVLLVVGIADDVSFAYLATALALLGLGIGLGTGAATTAAIESAPRSLAGAAAGTTSMMRYVGSIVGTGILAGVLSGDAVPGAGAFQSIYVVVTAMAIVAVIASLAIHGRMSEQSTG